MLYYFLQRDPISTGKLPQIQDFERNYDKEADYSIYNIDFKYIAKTLDFKPKFNLVLQKEAIPTDILDCLMVNPHFGLLCSEQVIEIFKGFNLPTFKIYETSIYSSDGKKLRDKYYWIHIICSLSEQIDFVNSSFKIATRKGMKKGNISINSEKELKEKKAEIDFFDYIRIEHAYFKNNMEYDILRLGLFDVRLHFSENLKEAFLNKGISGINFLPEFELMKPPLA